MKGKVSCLFPVDPGSGIRYNGISDALGGNVNGFRLRDSKGAQTIASCHEMKLEQVSVCEDCGLKLKVSKKCDEWGTEEGERTLIDCSFQCCGEEMKLKA